MFTHRRNRVDLLFIAVYVKLCFVVHSRSQFRGSHNTILINPRQVSHSHTQTYNMTIQFILMVNKQGQTRLAQYYHFLSIRERSALEGELVRKCLSRHEQQCSVFDYRNYKILYRRYASLYFIIGVDLDDDGNCNELAYLELIHNLVETLDKYFENVCELDIMFNLEKAHFILDEMVTLSGMSVCNFT